MLSDSQTKNPAKQRAGRIGARAKWGEPRILRLDELTNEQRRLVRAVLEASEAAAVIETPATASVHGGDRERPAA